MKSHFVAGLKSNGQQETVMLRNSTSATRRPVRKGTSPLVTTAVIAGLFTIVLTTAFVLSQSNATTEPKHETPVAEKSTPATPETQPVQTQQPVSTPAIAENKKPEIQTAKPVAQTESNLVAAHLAAGEFGPALKIAENVTDANLQSQLFATIAAAQREAGETDAAIATVRRITSAADRRDVGRQHLAHWASAAGGSGANFGPLRQLIINETSGPWLEGPDATGGTISELETGVRVDPNGLLSYLSREELSGRLKSLGLRARQADLNKDMAMPTNLRLVSLTRLEKEIQKRQAAGKSVVETMKNLAGLYKIEYVFVYPETGEIVIGGPAEGWQYTEKGQPVAVNTGKPTLQLDDFVTVLRTFSPEGDRFFNCLIVPRKDGLKAAKAVSEASQKSGALTAAGRRSFVKRLTNALGKQDVKVNGIPADSRVARVIVEADYRMKLIGIDKLDAGRNIPSYFDLLGKHPQKSQPSLDALRWWLTMKYDSVLHSKDRNVFHLQGSSVLCQGLNETITPDGRRIHTGKADPVNLMFAQNFSKHYAELAKRDLVFADLQNVFDLSLVAALIRHEQLDRKTHWTDGVFATGGSYQPEELEPVKTVMSVSNSRLYNGRDIVIQVAGGVRGDLFSVIRNSKLRKESPRLGSMLGVAKAPALPEGRWWWDAKIDVAK